VRAGGTSAQAASRELGLAKNRTIGLRRSYVKRPCSPQKNPAAAAVPMLRPAKNGQAGRRRRTGAFRTSTFVRPRKRESTVAWVATTGRWLEQTVGSCAFVGCLMWKVGADERRHREVRRRTVGEGTCCGNQRGICRIGKWGKVAGGAGSGGRNNEADVDRALSPNTISMGPVCEIPGLDTLGTERGAAYFHVWDGIPTIEASTG
jgi:hypothetical protein